MPKFKYTAVDSDGSESCGVIEGESRTGAGLALLERDLQVTELAEHKSILRFEISRKKVPRKDLMQFSRQMAVFLRAGIPVTDALDIIREEAANKSLFAAALAEMALALRGGSTFTEAAMAHPEAFPPFYIGVLEAAEMTGNLDNALEELAVYIDRDLEARRKIQSALFYPVVVLLMSIATVVVLTTFVLPRFKTFFKDLHAKLPLPTRMLLSITDIIGRDWPFILGAAIVAGLVLGFGPRTPRGRDIRDTLILKVPVVGDMVRVAIIERFCRTLSSMVRSGVSLPDALVVVADGTSNVVYRRGLDEVRTSMIQGEGLAGPVARTGLFPGAARQMIRVGEETGTLDKQLETSAKYFETELNFKITRFTNLFEPAVILMMGFMVGFVAIALVSAMYGIFNQVSV